MEPLVGLLVLFGINAGYIYSYMQYDVHITSIYEIKLNWEKVGRDFEKCSELKLC